MNSFSFFPPFYGNSYIHPHINKRNNFNPVYSNYSKKYDSKTYNSNIKNNKHKLNEQQNINSNDYFEILGIKLHYDDILLICLIFFLYKEGVKDETLFIGLILLLLS